MLAIRMQRTGRKGHAEFRIVVQDSRRTPTSGVVVAQLGHYNPHAKHIVLDKEKAGFYLNNGAQPSDSVVRLLTKEGIKMPAWVKPANKKSKPLRHTDKLRKNRTEDQPADTTAKDEPAGDVKDNKVPDTGEAVTAESEAGSETPKEAVATDEASSEAADNNPDSKPKDGGQTEPVAEQVDEVVAETSSAAEADKSTDTKT